MDKSNKISKGKNDPLLKLKEERDQLIKWSMQLKNNNSSYLGNEKSDMKIEEQSINDKSKIIDIERSIRIRKEREKNEMNSLNNVKMIKPALIDSNGVRRYNDSDENKEENEYKIRIHGNLKKNNNNNNIHIHLKNTNYDEEDLFMSKQKLMKNHSIKNKDTSKNHSKLVKKMTQYDETLKNGKGIYGIENEDKNDVYGCDVNGNNQNRGLHKAPQAVSNVFQNDIINNYSCSEDISDENGSFRSLEDHIKKKEEIKKHANENLMDSNNNYEDNRYSKKTYQIEIKEPICANSKYGKKSKNKRERNYVAEDAYIKSSTKLIRNNENNKNVNNDVLNISNNSVINSSGINDKNEENKRKIKLRRKQKREPDFAYLQIDKESNKVSNESINTFLPLGSSFLHSNPNSSGTTVNSYGEIGKPNDEQKTGIKKTENLKIVEANKITNLLKNQIQMLEKKEENLNDKMNDLHDNVYTLMDKNKADNLTVQHYELLIKSLETKYNKLFNMYQELDEHRTSYVDAYREKQTKIENLCACIQIKSEENLKMTQEINILNKKSEELQGQIYEYANDIEEKDKQLNKKKEEIRQMKNEIAELTKQLQKTTNELNEMTTKYNHLKVDNDILKDKFAHLEKEYNSTHEFYHSKIDNLQELLKKLIYIFQLNNENIINYAQFFKENSEMIQEKLKDNQSKYDDIINLLNIDIMKPIEEIILNREQENAEQKQQMENVFDNEFLKIYETNLQNVELANEQIHELKEKLKATASQRDITKNRAILLANGQGRLNDKSIIPDLKKINEGTLLYKCKYRTISHKPVLIYMKIINNTQITWTKDKTGQKRFKKRKLIELKDIRSIDYGITARPVYWHIEKQNQKKVQKKKLPPNEFYQNSYNINPYNCFTIYTKTRAYDFFSDDENIIASWVIGLGRLCSEYTSNPNIQSRSEFIVKKVQLKLKLYCIQHNISYTTLWKQAIERARRKNLNLSSSSPSSYNISQSKNATFL